MDNIFDNIQEHIILFFDNIIQYNNNNNMLIDHIMINQHISYASNLSITIAKIP